MPPSSDRARSFRGRRASPPWIFAASALLGTTAALAAPSVAVKDGNIVLVHDGQQQRQLTKSGKDAAPVLSPDGKWVAFTRIGNPTSPGSQGDCKSGAQADGLRRIQVDGTGEELLVRGRDGKNDPKQSICDFSSKQPAMWNAKLLNAGS